MKALEHLHSNLQVIHRGEPLPLLLLVSLTRLSAHPTVSENLSAVADVKPSNVLINTQGQVKMCDFGISGYLVDSVAKTMDAGCKPYMAVSLTACGRWSAASCNSEIMSACRSAAGEDQPGDQSEGLQRQVGHLEFRDHHGNSGELGAVVLQCDLAVGSPSSSSFSSSPALRLSSPSCASPTTLGGRPSSS